MAAIIAVASGKGGVGKTLITASLAVSLQRHGHRVLAVDADMGLRNLDLMFGMQDDVLYDVGDVMNTAVPRKRCCMSGNALIFWQQVKSIHGKKSMRRRISISLKN